MSNVEGRGPIDPPPPPLCLRVTFLGLCLPGLRQHYMSFVFLYKPTPTHPPLPSVYKPTPTPTPPPSLPFISPPPPTPLPFAYKPTENSLRAFIVLRILKCISLGKEDRPGKDSQLHDEAKEHHNAQAAQCYSAHSLLLKCVLQYVIKKLMSSCSFQA